MINPKITISGRDIGLDYPTYFIADVAANHDGDLERAKDLIYLAAERGADAAKFQHFSAETIVSDVGFEDLGAKSSHQASWRKSVFDVYQDASVSLDWTSELVDTCKKAGIEFFTSPYSKALVDYIDPFVEAYKIGSGDITWPDMIRYIGLKNKPTLLASGASSIEDVDRAMSALTAVNSDVCLMQCNTNYTASLDNFKYINLRVLLEFKQRYPQAVLGLSDHTPGHATVLGAVTLGARVIEKHLTDDNNRIGPDHKFSMDGLSWEDMVLRTRELENALGVTEKKVEDNEIETVVVQRRSLRANTDLSIGAILQVSDFDVLRPMPKGGIEPYKLNTLIGRSLVKPIKKGGHFTIEHIDE